jgi:hypothetical protein
MTKNTGTSSWMLLRSLKRRSDFGKGIVKGTRDSEGF